MDSVTEKILELDNYVNRLQDEMKTIDAFKDEIPLCMMLLNDAIVKLRNEKMRCEKEPILEEFIPLKKSSAGDKDEKIGDVKKTDIVNRGEKITWMSYVQLWNTGSDEKREEESVDRAAVESSKAGGGSEFTVGKEGVPWLSLGTPEIKNSMEDDFRSKSGARWSAGATTENAKKQKQRLCWSPELHRRFLSALQQLGGAQAATPKQIRELMKVDGLTIDEVKSHLQTHRLRKSSRPINSHSSSIQLAVEDVDDDNKSKSHTSHIPSSKSVRDV